WLRVPETMRFILRGKPRRWVTGKDVILSVIGRIGVDGARYRAMEYAGEGLRHLSMADRLSVANMTVEAGGKNGIMPVDDVARAYLAGRVARPYVAYESDVDAEFHSVMDVDLDSLPPLVAAPFSPANSMPAAEARGVKVTQVFIGSCTNGLLPDLRQAAGILRGRKLAPGVRMIVTPASQEVYLAALREGLIETFIELGAAVSTPGCGACAGVHTGVLGPDDVCVSTTNRNFHGRMGHFDSRTYLANAYVAAASAVAGEIVDPAAVCGIGPGEPLP
ncbi:MAG: 3-isopropylmalate dehydratase large subunit, partial [Chloroflexota bacterium]|nr:3-isopropylmalate dehydratase large subunit [Chloroflexota bacterium]